jgi:hypothetical protein
MGMFKSVDGDIWPTDYPRIVSGHIHGRQKPQENIWYPGACMQHNFGDADNRAVFILHVENKDYTSDEYSLNLPKKYVKHMTIDEVKPGEIEIKEGDHLKVVIIGNDAKFKVFKRSTKYQELVKKGIKVQFQHDKVRKEPRSCGHFLKILKGLVEEDEEFSDMFKKYFG